MKFKKADIKAEKPLSEAENSDIKVGTSDIWVEISTTAQTYPRRSKIIVMLPSNCCCGEFSAIPLNLSEGMSVGNNVPFKKAQQPIVEAFKKDGTHRSDLV